MGREHVEFVQTQQLPWEPCPWEYPAAGARMKVLSLDAGNGACSLILELPPGWSAPPRALAVAEEFLVLDGEFTLGDRRLAQDCYGYLPAGTARGPAASAAGAVLLAFYDARPAFAAAAREGTATFHDAFAMRWERDGMDPAYGDAGMRWKILRNDPATQDVSMLLMTPPHLVPPAWTGPQERHDCVEEAFVLSGDFLCHAGTMRTGAYFWRPPGILHGPYGTRGGNLTFVRTLGHALENNWSDHTVTISRKPPTQVAVPTQVARTLREWQVPAEF